MLKQILNNVLVQEFFVFLVAATLMSLTIYVNDSYGLFEGQKVIFFTIMGSSFAYAIFMARYDASRTFTDHSSRVIYRGILLLLFPVFLWNNGGDAHRPEALILILWAWASFYLLFDQARNLFKSAGFFTIGGTATTDKEASHLFSGEAYFVFKVMIFLASGFITWKVFM